MVTQETNISIVQFKDTTRSHLAYAINGSGLRIRQGNDVKNIVIELYNSQGNRTPGYLAIPIESIPEVIQDLNTIYNNVKK